MMRIRIRPAGEQVARLTKEIRFVGYDGNVVGWLRGTGEQYGPGTDCIEIAPCGVAERVVVERRPEALTKVAGHLAAMCARYPEAVIIACPAADLRGRGDEPTTADVYAGTHPHLTLEW